jgi:cytochrome b involved in lipid metabolism
MEINRCITLRDFILTSQGVNSIDESSNREVTDEWKVFRMSEVSEHCTPDSLWVVIEDKVYDITNFLHQVGSKTSIH